MIAANPRDGTRHVLVITWEIVVPRIGASEELLFFYGGFDAPETMNNTSCEAGFLAFMYPVEEAEQLR